MNKPAILYTILGVVGLTAASALVVLARSGVKPIAPPVAALAPTELPGLQPTSGRPVASPRDWPGWRGPAQNGVAEADPPVMWSGGEGTLWNVPVPGRGHASPCIWGDRIFLASADEETQVQSLLCFDRRTGESLWNTEVHRGGFMEKHDKNSHASATPVCDGIHVYVPFASRGELWVSALDLDGKLAWQTPAGPFESKWGYGSSPVVFESLVIVAGDNRGSRIDRVLGSSFIAALDRRTGTVVWRIKRINGDSYGSPIIGTVAGKPQLLMGGRECVAAYNPATGEQIWSCKWPVKRTAGSMAFGGDLVYASATHPEQQLLCIRADGAGDVTETHVVWREGKGAADIPSPLWLDNLFYLLTDNGILTCYQGETGKVLWKQRLGGNFAASLVAAHGRIYAASEEGSLFVIQAGPRYELLARNELGDGVLATPALCEDQIFIRTAHSLRCVGSSAVGSSAATRIAAGVPPLGGPPHGEAVPPTK